MIPTFDPSTVIFHRKMQLILDSSSSNKNEKQNEKYICKNNSLKNWLSNNTHHTVKIFMQTESNQIIIEKSKKNHKVHLI